MEGAVQYGTARSLRANFNEFPVMGKTGTCSNNGTRFGWFGSYADTPNGRIVTVFFLEGGRPTFGPKAAELTGEFYRALWDKSYFLQKTVAATDWRGRQYRLSWRTDGILRGAVPLTTGRCARCSILTLICI